MGRGVCGLQKGIIKSCRYRSLKPAVCSSRCLSSIGWLSSQRLFTGTIAGTGGIAVAGSMMAGPGQKSGAGA